MFERKSTLITLVSAVGITVLLMLGCILSIYHHADAPKLDPISEIGMERLLANGSISPESSVSVIFQMKSSAGMKHIESLGFITRFCWEKYCTGAIKEKQIAQLASLDEIKWIRVEEYIGGGNPVSRRRTPVIGIIDKGIDWRDESLWNAYGSRILYFWDQTNKSGPGPAMLTGATYGTEWTGYELSNMRSYSNLPKLTPSHGIEMTRLAVGGVGLQTDGRIASILAHGTESPVILVNIAGRATDIIDAVLYIEKRSEELGANRVISLSYEKYSGTHDASDSFVQVLDAALDQRTLLIDSVGNSAHNQIYTVEEVNGTKDIPVTVEQQPCAVGSRALFEAEGWYEKDSHISVRTLPPSGESEREFVEPGKVFGSQHGSYHLLIDARLHSSGNLKAGFHITTESDCTGAAHKSTWHIVVKAEKTAVLHMWITRANNAVAYLPNSQVAGGAVSAIAASQKAISVGAYDIIGEYADMAMHSSYGRLPDGRWKPDVLAPNPTVQETIDLNGGGTSAAAAIASRWVARIWAQRPGLSSTEMRDAITGRVLIPNTSVKWRGDMRYRPLLMTDK